MSDGSTKLVETVVPGDVLWSYQIENQFKIVPNVVTHVGTRIATLWELRYGSRAGGKILLTEEHPVLTESGWTMVRDLVPGQKLLKVWYQNTKSWKQKRSVSIEKDVFNCSVCGAKVTGLADWNRHRGDCYTPDIEKSPELLAQYSARMKEHNPMKRKDVARRAIESSRQNFLNDPNHGWHRNAERLRIWLHRHPSESQTSLYSLLDELHAGYEKEYRFRPEKRLPESKMTYAMDAAFPDLKLDVEVDGWWHYHNETVKAQDRVRDETLKENGWEVLRISGTYIFNHPEEVKRLILEKLSLPTMKNKKKWIEVQSVIPTSRKEAVYSVECAPDHNYVADAIIVHNCRYCQNYDISQRRKVEGLDRTPEQVADMAASYGCEGMAYTYNQPTIFIEYARDIGIRAHEKGIFNIFVSNGFDTPETVNEMKKFLDCVTVDFKGSGETDFVRKYIGIPSAEPIFQTLLETKNKTNIHIEITDLIIPQVGDNLDSARKLSRWVFDNLGPDTPIHFLRFHPDYKMMDLPVTPVKTLEKHYQVAREAGLRYVYIGNIPGHPAENTYCPGCGKVLIQRMSYDLGEYNLDGKNRCKFCGYQTPIIGPLSKSFKDDRFIAVM
jgi:pyruvate formate lyase activating enzyme